MADDRPLNIMKIHLSKTYGPTLNGVACTRNAHTKGRIANQTEFAALVEANNSSVCKRCRAMFGETPAEGFERLVNFAAELNTTAAAERYPVVVEISKYQFRFKSTAAGKELGYYDGNVTLEDWSAFADRMRNKLHYWAGYVRGHNHGAADSKTQL